MDLAVGGGARKKARSLIAVTIRSGDISPVGRRESLAGLWISDSPHRGENLRIYQNIGSYLLKIDLKEMSHVYHKSIQEP